MPKQISSNELDAVLLAVQKFPKGASLKSIIEAMEISLPRRTLQRRLELLVEQKKLILEGRGRGSFYRIPDIRTEISGKLFELASEINVEVYIPISSEGQEIKEAVRAPVQNRQPVSYNRSFLNKYRPNTTFYLSPEIRQNLDNMGRSPNDHGPAGTYARQIFNRLLIDLSWNSSRLEGNTYSLLETDRLLEFGEAAEGRNAKEAQMILNHKAAIELLVDQATEVGFNNYTILNLHALLSDNLLADPEACGRLRTIPVGIGGTVYQPLQVPQLINECFLQLLETSASIIDPFEQAFFIMVHLPYLQPFEDVNKRVSRLAANIPFIRDNVCPLSFVDVPEQAYIDGLLGVYELNRIELLRDVFIWAYERSCSRYSAVRRSLGEPDPFRLRHRNLIIETVQEVVLKCFDKMKASALIRSFAAKAVRREEHARFIEVAETELMGLHEGNIARYKLRPTDFKKWKQVWR